MHPCPGNWLAIGRAVAYHARAYRAFSAGIKCKHCKSLTDDDKLNSTIQDGIEGNKSNMEQFEHFLS